MYNAKKEWTKHFVGRKLSYPSEYLIRIFKGDHPRQSFRSLSFSGKKIGDIGCGDGGNLAFLKKCGFKVYGVEITPEIVRQVKKNLLFAQVKANIRVGANYKLPFKDSFFDFLVSWNAAYYMGDKQKRFETYLKEFARVLKSGGYLILSIPKKSCFVFRGSKKLRQGYRVILNDPAGVRNGEVLRMFEDENEIKKSFSKYFKNFSFGSQEDDCFGYNYHWHLVVCQKK